MDMLIVILKKKLSLRKIKMEICDWLKNYWVEELTFTALANGKRKLWRRGKRKLI